MDGGSSPKMRGIDIDLGDLFGVWIVLSIGKVAAERDHKIRIFQRFHARLVTENAVYADIVRVVGFEEFFRPRRVHHGRFHLFTEGDDFLACIARADPGIDGYLGRAIHQRSQFGHFGIIRTANGMRAVDLPVHCIIIGFGKHVAIDDYDSHTLFRERSLRRLGDDAARLRRMRDIFAKMRMLLVDLLLVDFLREVKAAFGARNVRRDQHDRRPVAMAFVNAVDEM